MAARYDYEAEDKWSLQEEISKVFKTALQLTFPDPVDDDEEEPWIIPLSNKEFGDYECNNVSSIWFSKRPEFTQLKHIAQAIKNNLPPNDMIDKCFVHSTGFLTFNLSRTWIAKRILKMLNDGIHTWAPKLPMKNAVLNSEGFILGKKHDILQTFILDSLRCMLGFSGVMFTHEIHVADRTQFHAQETLNLLREKEGLIEKSKGDKVIFVEEKEMIRHLITERKKKPLTVVKKNGVYDNALYDLTSLRLSHNMEASDWTVYVADVGKKEYIEMCFTAARRAGFLPTDEDGYPRTKFVGCGLVQGDDINRSGKLVDLMDDAKTRCKAALLERANADEFTAKELENTANVIAYGALKYALLKNYRIFDNTLNVEEMLNDKGNTGVYLLYAYAQICSIINESGKDIEELKKTRELTLEKDEERKLGLYLLQFTEVLYDACTTVFPNILCGYLYELTKKFTSFHSVVCQAVGGDDKEANRLLVCEATRVVMYKCFHLLGIPPLDKIPTKVSQPPVGKDYHDHIDLKELLSSEVDKAEMVSTCRTPAKRFKSPEEKMDRSPRFQLFSAYVHVDKYKTDCKPCLLYGFITVSDMRVSSEDVGWVPLDDRGYGYTDLFNRPWYQAVPVVNNDYIKTLIHPRTRRSIPFIDFIDIRAELSVLDEDDNMFFKVSNAYTCLSLSEESYDEFETQILRGPDGLLELLYIVLSDPVDAGLEISLITHTPEDYDVFKEPVSIKILAYYPGAGFEYGTCCLREDSYHMTLLEDDSINMLGMTKIPLNTSVLAVPATGSLAIDVLIKADNKNVIMKKSINFPAKRQGSSSGSIDPVGEKGSCSFKLNVKVNWI